MGLAEILPVERVTTNLVGADKEAVLRELAALLCTGGVPVSTDLVFTMLAEREKLASTGVGSGVAIPHARVPGVQDVAAALGVHRRGISFDAVDGEDVHIFVAVLASERQPSKHLKALASISRLLRDPRVRADMLDAPDPTALHAIVAAHE